MQHTIMRYIRRQSSDSEPTCPMCHTTEDHLTRLALSKRPATVQHCAKAVGLLIGRSLQCQATKKKKIYTYTPLCESLLLETRPHSGQDVSVRFQIEHWSLTHWTNENRRGCFKSRVESNIEQSANTIPGFEQQQCSHFPPCCSLCRQRFLC